MEMFYKISPQQATSIGSFYYEKNKEFNPFAGEQEDGYFIVAEKMYETLKDHEKFQEINFSKLELLSQDKLIYKRLPKPWGK